MDPALCWPASGLGAEGWSRAVMYSHLLREASLIANRIRFPDQAPVLLPPLPSSPPSPLLPSPALPAFSSCPS